MTRAEIQARYEAEVEAIRASGETHPQLVSMAMNEARRWRDRELDRAGPDDGKETGNMDDNTPSAKAVEEFSRGHNGRDLLSKHSLDDEGIWRAYGEDPNCDLGGHHHEPLLGTFQGRLRDVIAYASQLPNWSAWGRGGRIEAYQPPSIKRITADSVRDLDAARKRRRELKAELARLDRELGEHGD